MSALAIERDAAETALSYCLALAGDAIADAARLIAVDALAAEGAARRGDEGEAIKRLRAVAAALDDAREVYALVKGRASP